MDKKNAIEFGRRKSELAAEISNYKAPEVADETRTPRKRFNDLFQRVKRLTGDSYKQRFSGEKSTEEEEKVALSIGWMRVPDGSYRAIDARWSSNGVTTTTQYLGLSRGSRTLASSELEQLALLEQSVAEAEVMAAEERGRTDAAAVGNTALTHSVS